MPVGVGKIGPLCLQKQGGLVKNVYNSVEDLSQVSEGEGRIYPNWAGIGNVSVGAAGLVKRVCRSSGIGQERL